MTVKRIFPYFLYFINDLNWRSISEQAFLGSGCALTLCILLHWGIWVVLSSLRCAFISICWGTCIERHNPWLRHSHSGRHKCWCFHCSAKIAELLLSAIGTCEGRGIADISELLVDGCIVIKWVSVVVLPNAGLSFIFLVIGACYHGYG